jgi:hypothetical protein
MKLRSQESKKLVESEHFDEDLNDLEDVKIEIQDQGNHLMSER